MDKLQEKLRDTRKRQEKKVAISFLILFYIIMFGYDSISGLMSKHQVLAAIDGVGLGLGFYILMLLIIIPVVILIRKGQPERVKYVILFSYMLIYSIHEILIYTVSSPGATYATAHFFDFILILFAPMFVNRKFFFIASGAVVAKYLITFAIFQDSNLLFGTGITIVTFFITYIILSNFLRQSSIMEDSYQTEFELEGYKSIAYKDDLTGICNKRYLNLEIAELEKNRENIAVLMTDIDKFKSINDGYNHSVGDQALKHFVDTIKSELSSEDIFARYGGEEFTLILKNRSYEDAKSFSNRLREKVAKSTAIVDFNGQKTELTFTASFGLFYLTTEDKHSIKEVQNIADNLLYLSKKNGRNRVTANLPSNNTLYNEESYIELPNE